MVRASGGFIGRRRSGMKLLVILGTRPEVIKLAPVILAAKQYPSDIAITVCAAGQHKEMLNQALASFAIQPDISLDVMSVNQSLSELSAKLLLQLTEVINTQQPDWVMVQGDTTSAFIGSLAAFYVGVKVAHVEAGFRTHDLQQPFPEELNRQLIARIASLHFAPTKLAAENILQEGIEKEKIVVTGNTVVDAIHLVVNRWQQQIPILPTLLQTLLVDKQQSCALITCHRRESFGAPLQGICAAIRKLCERYTELAWIFPVHLNPKVRDVVMQSLKHIPNLYLIDPLDYEATLYVISRARLVLTDSGGIQEEAPTFGVPAVVMRKQTERQEGVAAGVATLVGCDAEQIITAVDYYLTQDCLPKTNPYGDGNASQRILHKLLNQPVEGWHA
jgi:UDP-N-acetylglucosamine 2-epimerase (non-hydrolysing)